MGKLQNHKWGQYLLVTLGTLIVTIGVYFFKFPNDFCFGGVTGIAVLVGKLTPWSPSTATFVMNVFLLGLGFLFLGKSFGVKTAYASLLMSVLLWFLEMIWPLNKPLTNQTYLEFVLAIVLPSIGAAVLFNIGASGGGTDILAAILKKYTGYDTGSTLFAVDAIITLAAFLVFDIQAGLYSFTGLMAKTLVINGSIRDMNLVKYFSIICDDPGPICGFIKTELHRGATICEARGAFSNEKKYVVFTVLGRSQAVRLRSFVKQSDPHAFITICNSSEIIGNGFHE